MSGRELLDRLAALKAKVTEEVLDDYGRHFTDGNYCDLTQCHHGDTGNYRNREDGQAVALLWNLWKSGALDEIATPPPQDHVTTPAAAYTIDFTGCDHMSRDVALIERIASAGSKGPTEVVYLYTGQPPSVNEMGRIIAERDALIAAGLKCCDGIPNPNLRPFDLALSFIDSTNTARKGADMLWQQYKAELDAIKSAPAPQDRSRGIDWENPEHPAVKLFVGFDVEGYVEEYELCGEDGDYSPNEQERVLLVDAIYGVVSNLHEGLRKIIPSSSVAEVLSVTPSIEESLRIQLASLRRERDALEMIISARDTAPAEISRGDIAAIREALSDPTIGSYPDFTKAVSDAMDELERLRATASEVSDV
ncbi:hypothetical protein [Rhizobium sp. PL01]|uniref:hypothetical protein n=1 Tax=Rhizobium sp. PL01 TaxID=3085631 RepID=UPI002981D92D|nr:hypothetical protein [Rhizobium sp. PL01]MDW5313750.1 hypothetical protein [Rhizobium sp. PL01]